MEKSEEGSVSSSMSSKSSKSESSKSQENSISEMVISEKEDSKKETPNPLELSFSASEASLNSEDGKSEKSLSKKTEKTNPLAFLDSDSNDDDDFLKSDSEEGNDFMANLNKSKKQEKVRNLESLLDTSCSSVEESIKEEPLQSEGEKEVQIIYFIFVKNPTNKRT